MGDGPLQLFAWVEPENARDRSVSWSSSDTRVVKVDAEGVVRPVAKGTAMITAKTAAGIHSAQCAVTVTPVVPQGITLDKDAHILLLGSTLQLKATVLPSSAENKTVTWSSANPAVATVDTSGRVTSKTEGSTDITVTTREGGLTATCQLTVRKLTIAPINPTIIGSVKVTGVSLDQEMLDMTVGGLPATLKPQIEPAQAQNKTVTWSSANPAVASVDGSGKVTPLKAGMTRIMVKTSDGGFTASATVMVETPNTEGSTTANLNSGWGNMSFQGGWMFYSRAPDGSGLFKMRLDGSRGQQLTTDKASRLNVIGDWVYYVSDQALYRIRTDGTARTLLNNLDAVKNLQVIGNTAYYLSSGSIFKMKTDGTSRSKVSDETSIARMIVHAASGKIYYARTAASSNMQGIYSMNLDGSGKKTLTSDRIISFTMASGADDLYYRKVPANLLDPVELYRITLSSGSKSRIGRDHYSILLGQGQHLYYSLYSPLSNDVKGIYRMMVDGSLPMVIEKDWTGAFYARDSQIYWVDIRTVFRIQSDGTGKVQLN